MSQNAGTAGVLLLLCTMVVPTWAAELPEGEKSYPAGIDLPEGEGRELLATACTRCHDLKGLPAYKGYWDKDRWRDMVETMVKHGARLDSSQTEQVAIYLARHFGLPHVP